MIFRPTLVFFGLVLALVFADVDVRFKSIKPDKRDDTLAKFSGYCTYEREDIDFEGNPGPESLSFNITFDTPVTGFKAKGLKVVSQNGTDFQLTNAKPVKNNKFAVFFSVTYNSTAGDCWGLSGGCSDIEQAA